MKDKKFKWNDVKICINGVEVTGITSIKFNDPFDLPLEDLVDELTNAELNEDYELCADLKQRIDQYDLPNKFIVLTNENNIPDMSIPFSCDIDFGGSPKIED